MTKKPLFWILIALASALSLAFSFQFFAQAFPLLNVEISMSREAALQAAGTRAERLKLAPAQARTAIRFNADSQVQNFIELEAGGKDAFLALLRQDVYQPLQWEVRFFKEKETAAVVLYFTPQGKPYGFVRMVPEKLAGAALDAEQARSIALSASLRDWGVDLTAGKSRYLPVEQSLQKRSNGRIDHTFVYEREDQRLGKNGEGRVRLVLVVSGDQLTQLQHVVKIPESFVRRYAEMRATNGAIAGTGSLAMGLLYILGGCVLGLILLKRQHFVIGRPAIKWAALVALLQCAVILNNIPTGWFGYDTAVPASSFIGQQLALAAAAFLGMWLLLGVSFMAAEGLSRKAYGHQPQLWKVWTLGAANSWGILGRIAGGYLWVGFDLLFIVAFYYLTQHYLGWWSPLESLVDPNILATPLPWLAPVANALQAGFWEECLFRAVPLAGAALIGDYLGQRFQGRLGTRKGWLAIGLVLQALIFGAMHAGYAQQPSYARPVELFLPSLLWGLVYLRFGLLPGIVFHFLFDLLLMSLPIFVTSAPGLGLDRVIVVAVGLTPLLIVLWARWRAGRWQELPAQALNSAWTPVAPPSVVEAVHVATPAQRSTWWLRLRARLPIVGATGLAAWLAFSPFTQDAPPMYLARSQAEAAADAALKQRGVQLSSDWQRFSQVEHAAQEGDGFVWREAGAKVYQQLTGSFLEPPKWRVRYVRFSGDVAERAEQWQVFVENGIDGKAGRTGEPHVRSVWHDIPEARPGKSLTLEEARAIAHQAVRERFGLEPKTLREVKATEQKRPSRTDWAFGFAVDQGNPLKLGEPRVWIDVAGDEVNKTGRYVYAPEEWQRSERERAALIRNIKAGFGLLLGLTSIGVIVAALMRATKGALERGLFLRVTAAFFALGLIERLNGWQDLAIGLSSSEPLSTQLWLKGAGLAFATLLGALTVGLFAGLGVHAGRTGKLGASRLKSLWLPGICLAAAMAGLDAGLKSIGVPDMPHWESLGLLNPAFGGLSSFIGAATSSLGSAAVFTFLLVLLRDFNADFGKRRVLSIALLLLFGFVHAFGASSLPAWLIIGLGSGVLLVLVYVLVARFEPKAALFAMVAAPVFDQLRSAIVAPYPLAAWYAGLQVAAICAVLVWWFRLLQAPAASEQGGPLQ